MTSRTLPEALKIRLQEIPEKPGVYFFKDREGKALYIGKALSLKKRVAGHFRSFGETFSKEGLMLSQVSGVDFLETPTEAEALLLEASLVKELLPKYNKMLRDDKSFPYLKITAEEYPRLLVTRQRRSDGGKYFGPYTQGRLLNQALKMLRREFPMRTCKTLPKKVCLQYHLGLCGGPCELMQSREAYAGVVKELSAFLEGRRDAMVRSLSKRMKGHAAAREYEKAQALYETIRALSTIPQVRAGRISPADALHDLQRIFSLPTLPRRIECFDISNLQGHEAVGSAVVFKDGEPSRRDYRHFRIRTVDGIDDYRMMREVVRRRYERTRREGKSMPDLVLIDGGKGHLSAVKAELDEMGLSDLPVLSIAKQHEVIFSPSRNEGHVLPPSSRTLQMIRHLRDEAHRFAIMAHRRWRRRETLVSRLDGIPGLGPKSKQKLLKKFGSFARIVKATEEELVTRGAIHRKLARRIQQSLG